MLRIKNFSILIFLVDYLTLRRPDLGEISFLNEFPICAAANGSFPWLNSSNLLKLTNMPWAVSGLRKPLIAPVGPMEVANIRLKATGSVKSLFVTGDFILYLEIISSMSLALILSTWRK
ncbi:hypothetical protein BpHYR1_053912 [Brachionus plicatilis]|uniref:Uncharacterized protein n=1 Tax=Brachionus plicatilis TaxID=10195 RepID=A0A3M7QCZ1_BRAPC|nr:hypothetical protein BpHYR1_053912 [Brachionus plicatilis]